MIVTTAQGATRSEFVLLDDLRKNILHSGKWWQESPVLPGNFLWLFESCTRSRRMLVASIHHIHHFRIHIGSTWTRSSKGV